jgi:hypothetical protein
MNLLLWVAFASSASGFRLFGIFSAAVTTSSGEDASAGEGTDGSWLDGLQWEEDCGIPPADAGDQAFLEASQLHPLLQIPVSVALSGVLQATESPLRTFCDTGAMRTIMSWETARDLGVLQHLDRRYAGEATGIGSCRVLGRLPAGLFLMHIYDSLTVRAPAITILESTEGLPDVELLLGLDFLREYQAIVDLRKEELRLLVEEEEYAIPFLRPRASLSSRSLPPRRGDGEENDQGKREEEVGWNGEAVPQHQPLLLSDELTDDEEDEFPDMSGV